MAGLSKIEAEFLSQAFTTSGGWPIFTKIVAAEFIKACRRENIKILGIDGFFILDKVRKVIQPSMEHSVDFTSTSFGGFVENVYADSLRFIQSKPDELFFEILCEE
ncbi:hypothetical protein [Turneriella parva]|uniref:Uncharacterized protein n=1 Tax=Turneriella parva (strain ATCC BAA-1111 / DSM 21527 / NCTC 11395 / H) TaxID=869212 RepID=I4B9U4_TURPD|nr:hypothetical protein [Turneriella parva]AFM14051.1 hypothetical protein Turpa_3414 [Turneriella parva DSM 21527]